MNYYINDKTVSFRRQYLNIDKINYMFKEYIFTQETQDIITNNKPLENYKVKSGKYVFDLISSVFCKDINIRGLKNVPHNTNFLVAFPHNTSILDGTLLNVLLLKEGYNSKAIARVKPDSHDKTDRDMLYITLSDFIITLKQLKTESGSYLPMSEQDRMLLFHEIADHLKKKGVILFAPEGKSNPFYLGKIKYGMAFMASEAEIPIVPCNIEFHEPITSYIMEQDMGKLYNKIDFTFYPPVEFSKKMNEQEVRMKMDDVMRTIADGYICNFKGGDYSNTYDISKNTNLLSKYENYCEDKFNPLFLYAMSLDCEYAEKMDILIGLIEKEFCLDFYKLRNKINNNECSLNTITHMDLFDDLYAL